MTKKKYNSAEKLLKIEVGELEKRIEDSLSIQKRKDILGELLVEFYEIVESENCSQISVENAQRILSKVFEYVESEELVDEMTIYDYRLTYRRITGTILKKALDKKQMILRRDKSSCTKSINDYLIGSCWNKYKCSQFPR